MIKLPIEPLVSFVNERSAREKKMLLVMGLGLVLALDYLILILPIQTMFADTLPKLGPVKSELRTLKEDKKNKDLIESNWVSTKARLQEAEKSFISADEVSMLLENFSNLAGLSGVKIVSLKPIEMTGSQLAKSGLYVPIPIKASALAGTHELGKFLNRLETNRTFFRITNLHILENPADSRRHLVEIEVEALRKGL